MKTSTVSRPKWKVRLCSDCIRDLEEYYSYICPPEDLEITQVPLDFCDNHNLDDYNERLTLRNADYLAAHNRKEVI